MQACVQARQPTAEVAHHQLRLLSISSMAVLLLVSHAACHRLAALWHAGQALGRGLEKVDGDVMQLRALGRQSPACSCRHAALSQGADDNQDARLSLHQSTVFALRLSCQLLCSHLKCGHCSRLYKREASGCSSSQRLAASCPTPVQSQQAGLKH